MILSQKSLAEINNPNIRWHLAGALDVTEMSVVRYIKINKSNGPLTTAGALKVIREKTGLSDDEILENEETPAIVN